MRALLVLFGGLLVGAGVWGLVVSLTSTPSSPPESAPDPRAQARPFATQAPWEEVALRLDRIERKLDDLLERPSSARTSDSARLVGTPDAQSGTTVAERPSGVEIDADALAAALEEVEARRWAEMNEEEVRVAAKRLARQQDLTGARRALERLLQRDLENEERAAVLTELGIVQRTSQDLAGSVASLREAIRVVGLDTVQGVQAGMQLAWTLAKSEDYEGALRISEDVVRARSSEGQLRTNMRWGIGVIAASSGDLARARDEFEAVIRAAEGDPNLEGLAKDARRRLDELR